MAERALDGVKVVDFGWVLVSPLIVKTLADYGATAVCVESVKSPSLSRLGTPFKDGKPGVDRAGHFAYCAPNKYSISLDLRTAGWNGDCQEACCLGRCGFRESPGGDHETDGVGLR